MCWWRFYSCKLSTLHYSIIGFVRYWQGKDMMEQRGGYLYGYYRDDSHYPEGCRAVLEGIYEPWGLNNGYFESGGNVIFSKHDDQNDSEMQMVEKI